MASRSFVAMCAVLALGLNLADAESTPATTAAVTEMPAAVTSTLAPVPMPTDNMASDTLALMVTDLTRSMADVYSLLQSELRTLTQQMQTFSSILGDVKTAVAVLQAKRPDPPQQMIPPPMPMPYMPPMGFAPQFAPAMIAPTPPMGFPANLLAQLQMQMPQQLPQQLPQAPPSPPQQQSPPAQPQPSSQQSQASQQASNQQDLLMTMLAGMTGSMPPVVPPMPNAPPGLEGPAGMLQAMMGAGAGAGGSPNPAAAMAAAMAAGGAAVGPAGPGAAGRRRDPTEMEGADMLMLMSMSGMFA